MPISKIKAGGINDDAVTTAKIVDGTVAAVDIADGAVTSAKLDTNINVAGTLDVTGNFTSQGIDDNATSTAMTLDSSGNLLVGKLSNNFGTTGVALNPDGSNNMTRASDPPLALNRLTSDGSILNLYKDAAGVGSIGTNAGYLKINSGSTSFGSGIEFHNLKALPVGANGASSNGTVDLGENTRRWKDLYLSGGVYLGGTVAANKLDDYEEGVWTPISPTVTFTSNVGTYTKIGNRVFVDASFVVPSTASGVSFYIDGLPFTSSSAAAGAGFYIRYTDDSTFRMVYMLASGTRAQVYNLGGGATNLAEVSTHRFDFSGTYFEA
jgi:hypothetical protein